MNSSNLVENIKEESKDLNVAYNNTSSDGGGLSSPPPRMIKIQRRMCLLKGKGWNSVVIHPEPKVEEIKELIREIKDKKEKHTLYPQIMKRNHQVPHKESYNGFQETIIQGSSKRKVKDE